MEKLSLNKFEDKKLENLSSIIGSGKIGTDYDDGHKCGTDTLHDNDGDGEISCGDTIDYNGDSYLIVCD